MAKKLLLVTSVFSPSIHANAKRPHLMAKYFVRRGWDVTVLTSAFQTDAGHVTVGDCDGIHVECIRAWPLKVLEMLAPYPKLRLMIMTMLQGSVFPDFFAPWVRQVARRVRRLSYDCAIVNVSPYSGILLEKYGVLDSRWVIDYQESLYPYLEQRPRSSPLQEGWTPKLLRLERSALRSCAGAWFTSRSNLQRYVSDGAVDNERTIHLPYFFDPQLYPSNSKQSDSRASDSQGLQILYGGQLDAVWRSPAVFFKAWRTFLDRCPEALGSVRLVLYGKMDQDCRSMAAGMGLLEFIDQRRPVAYPQFLAAISNADLLLFIDARLQKFFNPSKIADYFGARKPVLAFTAPGSDVECMLQDVGMRQFVCPKDDADQGANTLQEIWNRHLRRSMPAFLTQLYSVDAVCENANAFFLRQVFQKSADSV